MSNLTIVLDIAIVITGLPTIQRELGCSPSGVVDADLQAGVWLLADGGQRRMLIGRLSIC